MQEMTHHLFNKFKNQIDIWFFFGFLATFTLSIRKVLFFYPIQKNFNEYTSIYIYASDIFLILTLSSFIFSILCNNKTYLSKHRQRTTTFLHSLYTYIPLFLVILAFISITWSKNQIIATYRSTKLFEAYLLYLYTIIRLIPSTLFHVEQLRQKNKSDSIVPRGTIKETTTQRNSIGYFQNCSTWNNSIKIIVFIGLIQSIIAIWQFIIQRSIGLIWLKESIVSQDMPGVAKLILDGHKYIRAYGLFTHPNILGGFLLFSIIITILYKQTIVPRGTISASKASIDTYLSIEKITNRKLWLIYSLLFIQLTAMTLTFSKSAIIGLLLAMTYIKIKSNCSTWNILITNFKKLSQFIKDVIVPRLPTGESGGTITHKLIEAKPTKELLKLFHVEHSKKTILIILIVIALLFIIKPDFNSLLFKSLEERGYYLEISRVIISNNPLLGVGMGQFIVNIPLYAKGVIETWQFQPVHNIFLLIWSELGIFGLLLFFWIIWELFQPIQSSNVPRGTIEEKTSVGEIVKSNIILYNNYSYLSTEIILIHFQGILLGLLFIGLFDHYLWDIWPGQALFWIVMGTITGIKRKLLI